MEEGADIIQNVPQIQESKVPIKQTEAAPKKRRPAKKAKPKADPATTEPAQPQPEEAPADTAEQESSPATQDTTSQKDETVVLYVGKRKKRIEAKQSTIDEIRAEAEKLFVEEAMDVLELAKQFHWPSELFTKWRREDRWDEKRQRYGYRKSTGMPLE